MILRKQWTGFSCKSNASSLLPIKEGILQISTFRYRTKQSSWCWWHRSDTEAYARAEIKGTRALPSHSSKLLNIMSSLLLLPKTKFPIGKKNKETNPATQARKENKSGAFYNLAYITKVAAESEALLYFPYHSKLIFLTGHHATIFTAVVFLYSTQN